MTKRLGTQTVAFNSPPSIIACASVVGNKEGQGPLGQYFDIVTSDAEYGQKSWEKSESKILNTACNLAIEKSGHKNSDINFSFSGDLLNQCSSSHFAHRDMPIPFVGLYGACSTFALAMSMAAMTIDGDFSTLSTAAASSHFCSAEKQFRFPLEYGSRRTPSSQWTVTGAGCAVLGQHNLPPFVTHITTGKIIDMGIKDANNMGGAMAGSAADTIIAHLNDTGRDSSYYDVILTGDLGIIGRDVCRELLHQDKIDTSNYDDCGCMIFYNTRQDTPSGASGCGCCASTFCSKIFTDLKNSTLNKVLLVATGALLSPLTTMQGESIPCIAHAVAIEN